MGHVQGTLLNRRPTAEADLAFSLFGEFIEEVEQFRVAVGLKSATDLRHSLKIHRRCQPRSTEEEKQAAASILGLLTRNFSQFPDWRDLVKEKEHNDIEELMKKYGPKFEGSSIPALEGPPFPPAALYFDKAIVKLAAMFGTNLETGLSKARIPELQEHYGLNQLPEPPKPSILKMIWTQVSDYMVVILVIAAIAEFATDDPKAAAVLLIVVVLNIIIGFTQEYKANKALEALMSLSVPKAMVIRDGQQEQVNSADLVPGDLVVLDEGDAIPADLRLVDVAQLEIVEAILTGESLPVQKHTDAIKQRTRKLPLADCKGSAFMSTVVARGRGKGIVVRTGDETEIGRISKAIVSTPHVKTPIQIKLTRLGMWLVVIALVLCAIIVVIGVARGNYWLDMLKIGISLAVSVIPEGLVVVVTLTMAIGVRRMASKNAIVRKLPSVETLGSVTVICSDKTGTLTEGKMGTAEIWTADNSIFTFTNSTSLDPSVGRAMVAKADSLPEAIENLEKSRAENGAAAIDDTSAKAAATEASTEFSDAPTHLVLSTMVATLCNNASAGFSREFFHATVGLQKLGEYAFDSERKLMSVLYYQPPNEQSGAFKSDTTLIMVKGAPEGVLSNCTHFIPAASSAVNAFQLVNNFENVREAVNDGFVTYVSERAGHMASSGLRVLALAMRKLDGGRGQGEAILAESKSSAAETELTFVGLIGLIDPPKAGVKDAVTSCREAGIKVVMITGDHIATASSIAKDLGIIHGENTRALKGYEVDLLNEEALADLKPFPVVFARVSPDNKLKIVRALQSKGNIVAMTGDGVNDAPAIKKSDVGIAMGISGTEITKQAADIVLADDNFTTIVQAVKEGRRVFDNISKFIVYLLSCNSAEIWLFLLSTIVGTKYLPFTIIMILWANIIADVPPALSLGMEDFEKGIMSRPPRPPQQGVLTLINLLAIAVQGTVIMSLPLLVFLLGYYGQLPWFPEIEKPSVQQSLTFLVLTTMQLTQSFMSRSVSLSLFQTGIFGNKWMVYAYILSFVLMVAGYYIPGLNTFLELTPMGWQAWVITIIAVVIQLVIVEILKVILRATTRARDGYEPAPATDATA
ncbi:hypothetical protein BJ742DRAFT_671382 [Cladochytrium replicatum]|nr:hypothetical protein BJ742DRAFT_671382 [Cladochytrium replicatum]